MFNLRIRIKLILLAVRTSQYKTKRTLGIQLGKVRMQIAYIITGIIVREIAVTIVQILNKSPKFAHSFGIVHTFIFRIGHKSFLLLTVLNPIWPPAAILNMYIKVGMLEI